MNARDGRITAGDVVVRKLTSAVGAVIEGVDLRDPLSPEAAHAVRDALWQHGVIFLRGQDVTVDQLRAFAATFGTPTNEPFTPTTPDPVTVGDRLTTRKVTCVWHADATYAAEPPMMTLLRAVRLPPVGGDTCWSSMFAAYDALSAPMRTMLDGLTALHTKMPALDRMPDFYGKDAERISRMREVHPVIRVHPDSGRKALFVNEGWTTQINELTLAESRRVLDMLFEHVKSPDFNMRWTWQPGDVALWDNCATQHYAVPDYDSERVMQRVVLAGDRPVGPGALAAADTARRNVEPIATAA